VTVDTLNAQKTIASQVRNQKADYMSPLKDNPKHLRQQVEEFLTSASEDRTYGFEITAY
jgi:predicted transposase YbfD/YdcC